jgi:hypothetical protein
VDLVVVAHCVPGRRESFSSKAATKTSKQIFRHWCVIIPLQAGAYTMESGRMYSWSRQVTRGWDPGSLRWSEWQLDRQSRKMVRNISSEEAISLYLQTGLVQVTS